MVGEGFYRFDRFLLDWYRNSGWARAGTLGIRCDPLKSWLATFIAAFSPKAKILPKLKRDEL